MATYLEFVTSVKSMVFPDREAPNLIPVHTRYVLSGLVELQKKIPQLRTRNFELFSFGDTFFRCRVSVVPKPDGPIVRAFTYTKPDHCDAIFYRPVTRELMEFLLAREQCHPDDPIPVGSPEGEPPEDIYHQEAITDKGFRACYGFYAVLGNQIYVWPHLESVEYLAVEWSGIKKSYQNTDVMPFDTDIQEAVELYVLYQQSLREECDIGKKNSMRAEWVEKSSDLIWWYRKKELLPEPPWREVDCCPCPILPTASDGTTPPPSGAFTVYLGNAGPDAPVSYTEAQILAMENGIFSIRSSRSAVPGTYQIAGPADGENQYRLICIPASKAKPYVSFASAGFPLPMTELPRTIVEGVECRVFRTGLPSSGDFTLGGLTAISVTDFA